ncbi:pyruvate kinase [Candidatus Peregrinibacteria bacterium]|nr:pyruvate kinase [Candidatus Peregrinibacteria bacterium]
MIKKNTKIVCTIGPSSEDVKTLRKMVLAGMNVARLNFSHGTYKTFERIIKNVREVSKELDTPIAIMQDLQGPKIRVGDMPNEGISITKGQEIKLTTKQITGSKNVVPVMYKGLHKDVKPKGKILLKDGMIELHVISVDGEDINCKALTDGKITSHCGLNVPTSSIKAAVITKKDIEDLKFGLKQKVDYVAMSFVRKSKDIRDLRDLIKENRGRAKIIAKIERHEAVKNLLGIVKEADGLMVARGDLGVEIKPETVPVVQKKIIHYSNIYGKPVITATEVLQSMINNPRATRAEMSDAANAVFDHTDALMLSNETAVGKHTVRAVDTLSKVAISTENEMKKNEHFIANRISEEEMETPQAVCSSAARLANNINAKYIVAISHSGFSAIETAKHRVYVPIICITEKHRVERELQLVWGVQDVFVEKIKNEQLTDQAKKLLRKNKLVRKGDKIVLVTNASKDEKTITTFVI